MPGAPGEPVQRHVVGARRAVGDPKMHQEMVEQIAQDPQMRPDHATQMIAQVREKRRRFYPASEAGVGI